MPMIDRRQFIAAACATAVLPSAAHAAFASRRMTVTVRGDGRDVILVHGLDSSRAVWNGTIAALPGFRYHLVQIAGFGGLAPGANATGPVAGPVAAEIARYIAEARLVRPAVIGHSMGGIIALMLASRFPARVGKVMVVDILPAPASAFGFDPGMGSLFDRARTALSGTPQGRQTMRSLMTMFGGGADSDSDVTANALHELATTNLAPALPRLVPPLTVVFAEPSPDVADPRQIAAQYRQAYRPARSAKVIGVPNSGHMIMYDQPARFRAALKSFLA